MPMMMIMSTKETYKQFYSSTVMPFMHGLKAIEETNSPSQYQQDV